MEPTYDYGLWINVVFNMLIFGGFAAGFIRPNNKLEWRMVGVYLITIDILIHWPTLLTLVMWPLLMVAYYGSAMREEADVVNEFSVAYITYRQKAPAFIPSTRERKRVS